MYEWYCKVNEAPKEKAMNDRLPTYEDFVNKYGRRPPDIVFAVTQKDTRELTLKELGEWLGETCPHGGKFPKADCSLCCWELAEALKQGEMPR